MRAVDHCCRIAKLHIFSYLTAVEFGITGYTTIQVGFGLQVAKIRYQFCRADFHFFVALSRDHNPPMLQIDENSERQTDFMLILLMWQKLALKIEVLSNNRCTTAKKCNVLRRIWPMSLTNGGKKSLRLTEARN